MGSACHGILQILLSDKAEGEENWVFIYRLMQQISRENVNDRKLLTKLNKIDPLHEETGKGAKEEDEESFESNDKSRKPDLFFNKEQVVSMIEFLN